MLRGGWSDAFAGIALSTRIMSKQGGYGIEPQKLLPYLSIPNSEIGHVLVKDDQIIGYFTFVPLTHEQLMFHAYNTTNSSSKRAWFLNSPTISSEVMYNLIRSGAPAAHDVSLSGGGLLN